MGQQRALVNYKRKRDLIISLKCKISGNHENYNVSFLTSFHINNMAYCANFNDTEIDIFMK